MLNAMKNNYRAIILVAILILNVAILGLTINLQQETKAALAECRDMQLNWLESYETWQEGVTTYGTLDGLVITEAPEVTIDGTFVPIDIALSEEMQEYTYYLCKAYDIDYSFVLGVMFLESGCRVDGAGVDGNLMQICSRDYVKRTLGLEDMHDPYQSIHAGIFMLRKLFEVYTEDNLVLMAYNCGEGGAGTLWAKGVYETHYTNAVHGFQQNFANMLAEAGSTY